LFEPLLPTFGLLALLQYLGSWRIDVCVVVDPVAALDTMPEWSLPRQVALAEFLNETAEVLLSHTKRRDGVLWDEAICQVELTEHEAGHPHAERRV
jgi:hypothetical protein